MLEIFYEVRSSRALMKALVRKEHPAVVPAQRLTITLSTAHTLILGARVRINLLRLSWRR